MRKQTKLVAVLSASALLALGASMTSFAATGWTEENGTWVYYDNDGYQVTDTWKKSGNYWFWLNSDGEMSTNELVEDDGDYYYVDSNGAMVTNRWIQLENEDPDDDNDSEYVWYYFQNNGKAYTASDNGVSFKTINGKKYTFDDEGKMLWGWVDDNGDRVTDEADWASGTYYCGTADDGAMVTGWALLHVLDEQVETRFDRTQDEEEQDYYFYFNSNGKKVTADEGDKYATKTINGHKYAFDGDGVMAFEWNDGFASDSATDPTATSATWQYYNDRAAGNRAKGWFYEVPSENLDGDTYDDGDQKWFYAKNDGTLYANVIKTINGKKYAFNGYGEMLSGLQAIKMNGDIIEEAIKIDEESELKQYVDVNAGERYTNANADYEIYYFGDATDGAMKLSSQNVDVDGEVYNFYFVKSGENKGKGFGSVKVNESYTLSSDANNGAGIIRDNSFVYDDKAVYTNGLKVEADSDLRYQAVDVTTGKKYTRSQLIADDFNAADKDNLVLINASGSIMKNKSSVKDGDDYYYSTNKHGVITAIGTDKDGVSETEAKKNNGNGSDDYNKANKEKLLLALYYRFLL